MGSRVNPSDGLAEWVASPGGIPLTHGSLLETGHGWTGSQQASKRIYPSWHEMFFRFHNWFPQRERTHSERNLDCDSNEVVESRS
jgi:hypothetical protein